MSIKITPDTAGQRLERWLKQQFPHQPYGTLQKLLRTGQIRIDGHRVKGSTVLEAGQEVRLPPALQKAQDTHTAISLSPTQHKALKEAVLFEDEDLLALNKPPGIATQGGTGQKTSMDAQVRAVFGDNLRIVHRLDKGTSGVLLFAKNRAAAEHLGHQFKKREVQKQYLALVHGQLPEIDGEIDAPLLKDNKLMMIHPDGLAAQTRYSVIDAPEPGYMWLRVWPQTGRMHQIRAHLAAAGAPIVGDTAYGGLSLQDCAIPCKRKTFILHAEALDVMHPRTGKKLVVNAPFTLL